MFFFFFPAVEEESLSCLRELKGTGEEVFDDYIIYVSVVFL